MAEDPPRRKIAVALDPARRAAERSAGSWLDLLVDGYLTDVAARQPDRLAVVDGPLALTYGEIERRVLALAAGLQALGVKPGEAVSWQLPNWYEAYVVHMAILRIGAISNPIVPIYRHREVEYILAEAACRVVVVPDTFRGFSHRAMLEELRPSLPTLEHVLVARPGPGVGADLADLWSVSARPSPPVRSADDPVLLMFTSGTTARPKGAVHTHNTLDYENRSIAAIYALGEHDVVFMPSPVSHITGLLYGLQLPSMLGVAVVLQDVWDAAVALELIDRHRCTFTLAATPFLHGMVSHPSLQQHDLSCLRVVGCGGADVPAGLIREVTRQFGCTTSRVYGSTEFPTLSTSGVGDPPEKGATTDGHAIGAARFRIVDEAGASVPVGTVGELLVTGPEMFHGYLRPEDDTGAFTVDGFFHTGDLARADNDGYITIAGRQKDIVLRGGENISVAEVEEILFEHPDVQEVAIVAMPDPVMVERCCAYVVSKPGRSPDLAELCRFLEKHKLAKQKLPERLEVVAELPKTSSGKIQKFRLREMIRATLLEEATLVMGRPDGDTLSC